MDKSCTIQDVFERFYPSYEKRSIVLKNFLISVMKRTGSLTVKKLSMVHSRLSIILENIPTG